MHFECRLISRTEFTKKQRSPRGRGHSRDTGVLARAWITKFGNPRSLLLRRTKHGLGSLTFIHISPIVIWYSGVALVGRRRRCWHGCCLRGCDSLEPASFWFGSIGRCQAEQAIGQDSGTHFQKSFWFLANQVAGLEGFDGVVSSAQR